MRRADQAWMEVTIVAGQDGYGHTVRNAVAPLLAESSKRGLVRRGCFLRDLPRHEPTGLVVQVELACPDDETDDTVMRLGEILREIPAATVSLVQQARQVPLERSSFVGRRLATVTREFLSDVTPTLMQAVYLDLDGQASLLASALELMAAHMLAAGPPMVPGAANLSDELGDAPLSFLSLRSHAEAFIASSRDPHAARTALDRRYEAVGHVVEEMLSAVLDDLKHGRGKQIPHPVASGWLDAALAAKPRIAEQFRLGELGIQAEPHNGDDYSTTPLAASSFHSIVHASADLRHFLSGDPTFLAMRLLTSLLYLSLHNLGLSILERYFLCHAVSRACEVIFDVDGASLMAKIASFGRK
jgi:hypothetical protein